MSYSRNFRNHKHRFQIRPNDTNNNFGTLIARIRNMPRIAALGEKSFHLQRQKAIRHAQAGHYFQTDAVPIPLLASLVDLSL
jgi:hypothetical protein